MKWIVFVLLSLVKLLIISSLVILSVVVLPIIAMILLMGVLLGTLRDHEHHLYNYRLPIFPSTQSQLQCIKVTWHYLSPQQVTRLQHILINQDKNR